MSDAPNLYQKARTDVAAMLGYDLDALAPEQSMRVDVATALRVLLDTQSGKLMRGESLDARELLMASEALSRLLPPAALREPPSSQRDDHEAAIAPLVKLYRYLHELVHRLTAENGQLRAALKAGGVPVPLDVPTADIVPPGEIGQVHVGAVRGPDDPPPRSTTVIEGKANPPAAPPAKPAWQDWLDRGGGGAHYDRWANRG